MRSVNIDIKRLVGVALASGVLTVDDLREAVNNPKPQNTPCGFGRDDHGHFYSLFIATDRETGAVRKSDDGARIKFNLRSSSAKRQQAQTPGQALSQGQPAQAANPLAGIDPATARALLAALSQPAQTPAPAEVVGGETDFSGVMPGDDEVPL